MNILTSKIPAILVCLICVLPSFAQSFDFTYDKAGNRVHREMVEMKSMQSTDTAVVPLNSQWGEMKITLSPNPTAGILGVEIINLPAEVKGGFQLFNLQGAIVLERSGVEASNPLDLSGLPKGQYILVLLVNEQRKEWGVVKQ